MVKFNNKIKRIFLRFGRDTKGVAAIEFAIIAPLLIVLWLGTVELSTAITVDRKVSRVASTVADLITQASVISDPDLQDIFTVSEGIMFPYDDRAKPNIEVTGLEIINGNAEVIWSRTNGTNTGAAAGTTVQIPDRIKREGAFLIMAEVSLTHEPLVGLFNANGANGYDMDTASIELSEQLFLRPRRSRVCVGTAQDCTGS